MQKGLANLYYHENSKILASKSVPLAFIMFTERKCIQAYVLANPLHQESTLIPWSYLVVT